MKNNFYIEKSNGISFRFYSENNKILRNRLSISKYNNYEIISEVYEDFFVTIDKKDIIHLICQSNIGEIIYLTQVENTWNKKILLKSKQQNNISNFFKIICLSNSIHFFYIIKNKNKHLLINQKFSNGIASIPNVIDYINFSENPFSVEKDFSDNIYLFYSPKWNENLSIGYKLYDYKNKNWSDYIVINKSKYNTSTFNTLIDNCNNINLTWIRKKNEILYVVFQKILSNNLKDNNLNMEVIIHSTKNTMIDLILFMINDYLYVSWKIGKDFFVCVSSDNHLYWNKPIKYDISHMSNIYKFYYFSNLCNHQIELKAKELFGNIDTSLQIYLIDNINNQYYDEIAISSENIDVMDDFNLFFQNIKNNFIKIFSSINSIKVEKKSLNDKYQTILFQNSRMNDQINDLNSIIDKLEYQNSYLQKKVNNMNIVLEENKNLITKYESENADLKNQIKYKFGNKYFKKYYQYLDKLFKKS